ncbi:hypothetical protein [uncultured Shewanella sp.]|uniref:hypothetical protein n=1 Tax=uncultured Shewanella sp. TaxID=173975 RepID=UPI002634F701|nr:hypothetical protein [uncultured Shewanella sp.]
MFNLTHIQTARKYLVLFVLLMAMPMSAHAESSIDIDLSHRVGNTITAQMDEAVDSLKAELSLLIQLQMSEMLFEHQLGAILAPELSIGENDVKSDKLEQE